MSDKVALGEWLQKDVNEMPMNKRAKVANYLLNHLSDFNAGESSVATQVSLSGVISFNPFFIIEGSLSFQS